MKRFLFFLALFVAMNVVPSFAQSSDNDDEVVKIDAQRSRMDFRPGQVLVKFKDGSPVTVAKSKGFFQSVSATAVDAVMKEFGVETMDKLLPNEQAGRKLSKSKAYNGSYVEDHDMSQVYFITTKSQRPDSTMMLAERLEQLDEVEFAEPNYKVYAVSAEETADEVICATEDNPLTSQQWGLDAYGVKELWNKPIINKKRPIIAILDTGVDITHPDLVNNIWTNEAEANGEEGYDNDNNGFNNDVHGWDFINNTPDMLDFNMHGTHVAGIAAASNNGTGIVGANPQALLMPISVLQSDGTGDVATVVKGIDYAVANGATVLNMSLGTYANSRAMRQALERAYQNAVIVAAAGNEGRCVNSNHHPQPCYGAAPMFPGAYSFVLGVQATTQSGGLAVFSNYDDDGANTSAVTTLQDPDGFNYELKAPGANILSTIPGGKYKALNGTSMASPLVAGAVSALLMVKEYDSQEILWGDLLHTANIADAYAVADRPAELDIMSIQMRDRKELSDATEEDYSNDNEIDAGETVSIFPVIRTTFGEASNIKMRLEMGDEFEDTSVVEILTDEVEFGMHLDAYGKGVALNPV
ncbi:MAG: S8 family serine peptidase, partial [Bacteroidaceae bacterium]|nr:S8 family serine peptidase [Bacteroidaceae bacterium]